MGEPTDRDNDLVLRTLGGEIAAFQSLVVQYQDSLVRLAFRISGDFHAAEDLAQDSFVKAFERLDQFDADKGAFSSWLFAITRNVSLNARRKTLPTPIETADEETCKRANPSHASESRDQFRLLNEAIENLEEPFRSAFLLAEIEELPLSRIAEMESVPIGTIKSRISRAKSRLQESLRRHPS